MQWWRCEVEKRAILAKIVEWEIAYETCMLGLKKKNPSAGHFTDLFSFICSSEKQFHHPTSLPQNTD